MQGPVEVQARAVVLAQEGPEAAHLAETAEWTVA
jgi:hypothetical protein